MIYRVYQISMQIRYQHFPVADMALPAPRAISRYPLQLARPAAGWRDAGVANTINLTAQWIQIVYIKYFMDDASRDCQMEREVKTSR